MTSRGPGTPEWQWRQNTRHSIRLMLAAYVVMAAAVVLGLYEAHQTDQRISQEHTRQLSEMCDGVWRASISNAQALVYVAVEADIARHETPAQIQQTRNLGAAFVAHTEALLAKAIPTCTFPPVR